MFGPNNTVFPVIKENKILQNDNYYLLFVNKVDESYMIFSSPQRTTNLGIKDYSDNVSFKIDNDSLPIHGMKFKIKNILDILKH